MASAFSMPFTAFRIVLILCCTLLATVVAQAAAPANEGTWKGYIGIDAATGNVLIEDRSDVVTPPASMAKLMTFAVIADKLQARTLALETPVAITAADAGMGGTQVFLATWETFTVEELIYAIMIQSANDAAHALARISAGSVDAFVEQMNLKARALGMTQTTFHSPHGLPPNSRKIEDGDLSTPRDFATLSRYLLQNTDVLKYSSVRQRDFGPERKNGPMHMVNHNKLLTTTQGVDGLKTGYTKGAGYCLSTTAMRNGKRVIVVIMGSLGPDGQIDRGRARDRKANLLLEQSFAALPIDSPLFTNTHEPDGPSVYIPVPVPPTDPTQPIEDSQPEEEALPTVKFILPAQ